MGSRRDNALMARERTIYSCIECGGTSPKWLGRCPSCGAWNTLEETIPEPVPAGRNRIQPLARTQPVASNSGAVAPSPTDPVEKSTASGSFVRDG